MPKPRLKPATPDTLGAQAKTALERVEALTTELEAKVKMTREAWLSFGQTLLEARRLMPDKQKFGRWVRQHSLNTGLAKRPEVRSNAAWMAERWGVLQDCKWLTGVHPTELRKQYLSGIEVQERFERRFLHSLPRGFMDPLRDLASGAGMAEGMCRFIDRENQVPEGAIEVLSEHVQQCQQALDAAKAWLAENELPPEVYIPFHHYYT